MIGPDWWLWTTGAVLCGYLWFGLRIWRGLQLPTPAANPHQPKVSVIVAARNEANSVGTLLEDLTNQNWPADQREIILVDDGSTDGTGDIVRQYNDRGVMVIRIDEPPPGVAPKKFALARGIAESTGEFIVTTDADCRVSPSWIAAMIRCFDAETGIVAGYSRVQTGDKPGFVTQWEAMDFLGLMAAAAGAIGAEMPMGASGQNLAYRRQAYEDAGGFTRLMHRPSGDDVLLLQRIVRTTQWRCRFCKEPDSFVSTRPCSTFRALLQQRMRWASNASAWRLLSPVFSSYLVITWGTTTAQILLPLLWLAGWAPAGPALLVWGGRLLMDWLIISRGGRLFGRTDLFPLFPLWAFTVPLYIVMMGLLSPFGKFTWKGRAF